jgi:N-acetylmuramoyl-L-alanine amidase
MIQKNLNIVKLLFSVLLLFGSLSFLQARDFVVVVDPGHGGHDPGAIGQISQEKDINLRVALALGNLIETNCNDVRVIYTRKTDVFIPLDRRAEIANEAKADLFISIHTNSLANSKTYVGPSTWTLGLAKSNANLNVAKRENSVILYENDYKTRYAGFNPNSSESYIIFEFMQDKYMKESVHLASLVQNQFRSSQRIDRGVHQAGFLVLKASAMPSVLVELGFISTPDEEIYLNSSEGVSTLSNDIYRAFMIYKRENEIRRNGSSRTIVPPPVIVEENASKPTLQIPDERQKKIEKVFVDTLTVTDSIESNRSMVQSNQNVAGDSIVFKLQLMATTDKLADNDSRISDITDIEFFKENGFIKYCCAASSDYHQVYSRKKQLENRFKGAFIVAYKNGVKMDVNQAIAESKERRK